MHSKIKSAAVALAMVLSFVSSAQTSRFGISLNSLTTNFNYGNLNAELRSYKKNYTGFQAGFSYQAGIAPWFSVVPEIYFAIKGGTLQTNNPLTVNKSTLRLNSFEIPILARLHCNNFYLNAGPYAGYIVGGRLKVDGSQNTPQTNSKVSFGNAASEIKRWDFGLQAGAGYNFNLKQSILTLDVRYGYGLVNISNEVKRYNRMLNISVQVSKPNKKYSKQNKG